MVELFQLLIRVEVRHALDCFDACRYSSHNFVGRRDSWVGNAFVLKVNGVAETLAVRMFDMTLVSSIVLRGCVKVPSINGVECPCTTRVGFLVYLDITAHWCQWHLVVVKRSVQMGAQIMFAHAPNSFSNYASELG